MYAKLVPETVNYTSSTSSFFWKHLYLFIICTNYLASSVKVFCTTWTSHWWATGSSAKPSISGMTLSKNPSWVPVYLAAVWHIVFSSKFTAS